MVSVQVGFKCSGMSNLHALALNLLSLYILDTLLDNPPRFEGNVRIFE